MLRKKLVIPTEVSIKTFICELLLTNYLDPYYKVKITNEGTVF